MKQAMVMVAIVGLMSVAGANAETAAKADPAKGQQIVNAVCVACHGVDGNSPLPVNPKLASQHPEYLNKQLINFKSGERKSPIMAGMVAALTPEDMQNLAAYFASQKPAPAAAKDKALAAQGEKIYRGGIAAMDVPACSGCHGPAGSGIPAMFPRLAGQHVDYVVAELIKFRSGDRANDPGKMMRMVAMKMSEQDMKAVAEYISGLH